MGQFFEGLYEDLSLYVRQQAWLNAVPQRPKKKENAPAKIQSRIDAMRDTHGDGYEPSMPPVDAGEHLLGYLFEIGPSTGDNPISFGELGAWQSSIGIELQPWEARFLRRLSREYLSALSQSAEEGYPSPWQPDQIDRRAVADSLQESIRALAEM